MSTKIIKLHNSNGTTYVPATLSEAVQYDSSYSVKTKIENISNELNNK